MKTTFKHCW